MIRNHRRIPYQGWILGCLISFTTVLVVLTARPMAAQPYVPLFEEVWQTINDHFYDPNFNGVDWQALQTIYQPRVAQAQSREAAAATINQMLSELKTSHTRLYTPDEPAYYQVLGIFAPRSAELQEQLKRFLPQGKIEYTDIGIFTKASDGKVVVSAILEGSPAAGKLQVGDQLLGVDGQPFHPIRSFAGKADQPVTVTVQASPALDPQQIQVTPKQFDATTMFLDAEAASVAVVEQDSRKIGYIHLWSVAAAQYQQLLEQELLEGQLKDTDAFVLDIRDGWGGTPATVLNLYTGRGPSITSIARDGNRYTSNSAWNKPVVMLVNQGSRSAKEILAYGFQRYHIGPVVGSKTAGAVVAGRPFLLQDGSLLYVAHANVLVDGDVRLEGVGVTPDVIVPEADAYAQGEDLQKAEAIDAALKLAKRADNFTTKQK